jgi:polysaccharide biosynthesis/export protein
MRKSFFFALILLLVSVQFAQFSQFPNTMLMIKVSIVGAVEHPGVYQLEAGSRLSEAIYLAEQLYLETGRVMDEDYLAREEVGEGSEEKSSQRNIKLQRGEEFTRVDLAKYRRLGDLSQNPVLRDGDVIHVPQSTYNLTISGAVNKGDRFEFVAGDRISDLIELSLGLHESARRDSAILIRTDYSSGATSELIFSPWKAVSGGDTRDNLLLASGDRIYIRALPEYNSRFQVTVSGDALYPGDYAIEPGKTTLLEVLRQSGGANRHGSLRLAYLQRISARDTTVIHDNDYKRIMNRSFLELSYLENEYLKFKQRSLEGKVVVNFEELWNNPEEVKEILLEDSDYIYIPRKIRTVEVMGAVMNPGNYEWHSGMDYEYYIDLAGGYTNRASKHNTRFISAESGAWMKRKANVPMEQGDKIFVPEKEEMNIWALSKETISVLAQLATVIIAVININSN